MADDLTLKILFFSQIFTKLGVKFVSDLRLQSLDIKILDNRMAAECDPSVQLFKSYSLQPFKVFPDLHSCIKH